MVDELSSLQTTLSKGENSNKPLLVTWKSVGLLPILVHRVLVNSEKLFPGSIWFKTL